MVPHYGLAGSEQELAQLVERIDKTSNAYGMEINAEQAKLMTHKINGKRMEIKASCQNLQTVTNFKYLGAIITDAGSKADICFNNCPMHCHNDIDLSQ